MPCCETYYRRHENYRKQKNHFNCKNPAQGKNPHEIENGRAVNWRYTEKNGLAGAYVTLFACFAQVSKVP